MAEGHTSEERMSETEIVESTGNRLIRRGLRTIAILTLAASGSLIVAGVAFGELSGTVVSIAGSAAALFVLRSLARVTAVCPDGVRIRVGRNEEFIPASDIRYVFKTPRYSWSGRFGLYIAVRRKARWPRGYLVVHEHGSGLMEQLDAWGIPQKNRD